MKSDMFFAFRRMILILCISFAGCTWNAVPPLNQGEMQPYLPGKFVWYDLFTNDLSATIVFYKDLFGWEFADSNWMNSKIKVIRLDGIAIANAIEVKSPRDDKSHSRWLGYISVDDVNSTVDVIKELGGKIHKAPKEVPNRGQIAACFDPQGAFFAVVHSSTGDPQDKPPVKHMLIGSELWTNNIDAALDFYTAVFGYSEMTAIIKDGSTYRFLEANDKPRAGIVKIMWKDVQPNWVPYIVVENVPEIIKKAEALGGQLLLGLREVLSEESAAILADPTGGIFGVQQIWKAEEMQP